MNVDSISNSMANLNVNNAVKIEVAKKSVDTQTQLMEKILEDNFENTMKIQQQVANVTGIGGNLNIKI